MTKGGKIIEKTKSKAKKKLASKTSLKVMVIRTAKPKNRTKEAVESDVVHEQTSLKQEAVENNLAKEKTVAKHSGEKKEAGADKKNARILYEKVEKDKLMIIRIGVSVVMTAIVVAWFFTLKSTIKVEDTSAIDLSAVDNLKQMTETVSSKIEQINSDLEKVKAFSASSSLAIVASSSEESQTERSPFEEASSSLSLLMEKIKQKEDMASTSVIDINDISALKKRIQELENKKD
jgi:hypothetical protein